MSVAPPLGGGRVGGAGRARAYAALAGSMALVGTYVALSRPLTAALPVFMLALLRFAIAAVAMLPWTLPAHGAVRLTAREHRLVFAQAFFGNFLFSICMLYGLRIGSATAAGVVLGTLPAVVAAGSHLLLRERLQRRAVVAVALAAAGVVLLAAAPPASGDRDGSWLGTVLLLGSVFCEAIYVIIGKRLASRASPLHLSALINLWGLVLILPFGIWQWSPTAARLLTPGLWLLVAFYAIAASLLAVWLWLTGLRAVPASHAGVFTIAMPLAATAVGVVVLGEALGTRHLLALAFGIASIALVAGSEPAA